jgi:hypothetical protein
MTSPAKSVPSTATRTIRIDADIAPRAALLAAAAARMGASDSAIEQVLTAPREAGVHLTDEELVNLMVEATDEADRDTVPMALPEIASPPPPAPAPPASAAKAPAKKRARAKR